MTNNKLKKCDDILDYLLFLEKRAKALSSELDSLKYSFFNKEAKTRKKLIKCNLKNIYDILEYYENFLEDATTFQRADLDVFFVKYFTALYGIKYTVEENAKDKSEGSDWIPTDIIASERDFARIDKKYNFKRKVNVDDIIDMCQDSCLCIGGPEEYTLLEGTILSPELRGFPELVDVIKILVDLKISDPDMSDEKRLALGLKVAISRINKKPATSYSTEDKPKPITKPVVEQATAATKPVVEKPIVVTQSVVERPSFVTQPAVERPSFVTQPAVERPSFVTQPVVERPSFVTQQAVETTSIPTMENHLKSDPDKVLTKSLMGKYLHRK